MNVETLDKLLLDNVLDVRFVRRHKIQGKSSTRRMLCTKSYPLLASTNGKIVLNYQPPKGGHKFNESKQNACIVWDILMQNYRVVSAETAVVINQYPADSTFWEFFNKNIYVMSQQEKINFMDT
jgi:hypothetical protein